MIQDLVRGREGTIQEITDELNALSVTKTDSVKKYVDDLIDAVGAIPANIVLESLQKAGRGETPGVPSQLCLSEWHLLNGAGSDVSRPGVQAMLTALGQIDNWPQGLADSVKAIGVWNESPAEDSGFEPVTTKQVEEAIAALKRENALIDWRTRFDAACNTIGTSEQPTGVADLRAIANEIEAG